MEEKAENRPITAGDRGLEKLSKEQKQKLFAPSGIFSKSGKFERSISFRGDRMSWGEFFENNVMFKLLDTGKSAISKRNLLFRPGVFMGWEILREFMKKEELVLLWEDCRQVSKTFHLADSSHLLIVTFTYDRESRFLTDEGLPRLSTNLMLDYTGAAGGIGILDRAREAFQKEGFVPSEDIPELKPRHTINVEHFYLFGNEIINKNIMLRYHPLREIRENYPKDVIEATERVVASAMSRDLFGRLVIMHGPAGTGKTTLVQSLLGQLEALGSGYEFIVISDPELFLTKPGFYYSMIAQKPRVVFVLEDVGDLMSRDNKRFRMAEVSNFLNMTDGILARGREDIFITSFNYKLDKIEDAFDRAGRCLENIYFPHLRAPQAKKVLARLNENSTLDEIGVVEYALSDLYALARGKTTKGTKGKMGFGHTTEK